MNIRNLTRTVFKGFYPAIEVLIWVGYIAMAAIVLIVFVDVCGRYFLNHPLLGSEELVEFVLMPALGGFAIMYAAVKRGHVAVDLVVARFPRRTQIIMQSIASLLGFGIWAVVAYQVYLYALEELKCHALTENLRISLVPFNFTLALGTFLCCLTLLIQACHPEVSEEKPEKKVGGL